MAFYVYRPITREFLADDERTWTADFFEAAGFDSRELADGIAVRELGEGHDAYVLDDGRTNEMDHNTNAAARQFGAHEAANEHACYCAAQAHGLTPGSADNCDDGARGCPACPFKRTEQQTDALLRARGLPAIAYVNNHDKTPGAPAVIAVKRGESGYSPVETTSTAEELNRGIGVTPAQAEAMYVGSMMGWDVRGAFPSTWERLAVRRQEVWMQSVRVYDMADPASVPRAA